MATSELINKAVVRDTSTDGFAIADFTDYLEIVPRVNKLITGMGLFEEYYGNTDKIEVERVTETNDLIPGRLRGGERNKIGSEDAITRIFKAGFFPLDRNIKASDIQSLRKYASTAEGTVPKTLNDEVARVMRRVRNSHANTLEKAMIEAIKGKSYVGTGGVGTVENYYTVWGQTPVTADVNFIDDTTDPRSVVESVVRPQIIDNAGDQAEEYVVYCLASRTWFEGLITHPLVEAAYNQYEANAAAGQVDINRDRPNGNSINRKFFTKGVMYIEDVSGYMDAGDAWFFPEGIEDMFQVHYAPADDAREANQTAKAAYVMYKESDYFRESKVESESSFICINTRPELCVQSTGTFA
jgi:hypothetical protein